MYAECMGSSSETPRRICATCKRVLDIRMTALGVQWEHTWQDRQADHEPVPVLPPAGWREGRCDFCNADKPAYELPVRDFVVPGLSSHESTGAWAACEKCAAWIRVGNWQALEKQAVQRMAELGGLPAPGRVFIRMLYSELRKNISGPLKRL